MLQVFLYPTKLLISERRAFKTMKLVTTANFSNGKVMELEIKKLCDQDKEKDRGKRGKDVPSPNYPARINSSFSR